jgi:hypothetical protein
MKLMVQPCVVVTLLDNERIKKKINIKSTVNAIEVCKDRSKLLGRSLAA